MPTLDVGDGSTAKEMVLVGGASGTNTVTLAVNSASVGSLDVFANGIDGAATNVAAGANTTITSSAYIAGHGGVATVQITDTAGFYGNV